MDKLRALFGEWMQNFYSCDVDSFEEYLRVNKTLPVGDVSISNKISQQSMIGLFNRNHSKHPKAGEADNSISKKSQLKYERLKHELKDLTELWVACDQPPNDEDVTF